jgi:hypothetical protein
MVNHQLATAGLETLFFDELGQYLLSTRKAADNTLWRRIILEWKECPENWRKGTKSGGWEVVPTTCLSIFGCMVPDNLNEKEMQALIKDGTLPRFMVISPPKGTMSEVHSFEIGYIPTPSHIVQSFNNWHERLIVPKVEIQPLVTTKIGMTREAHRYWHEYRVASRDCIVKNNIPSSIAAYYKRLGTEYVKLAAIAASFDGCTQIDVPHLAMVYPFIEQARVGIHRLIAQSGTSLQEGNYEERLASEEREILKEIKEYLSSGKKDFTIPLLTNKRVKLQKIRESRLTEIIEGFVRSNRLTKEVHIHPKNKKKTTK